MNGSRRVRAPSVLPRSGPSCIFKGHLSTKSNAFCTDSSSLRLSTLHMVKNHMAVHYNKILSAKAVVDCSVPLSMSASIKYADQQRREKLKKELAQCERELKFTKTTGQTNSKNNSKALFNTLRKLVEEPQNEEDALIIKVNGYSSFTKSPVTSSERLQLGAPKSNEALTNGAEKSSGPPRASADHLSSAPRRTCSAASAGRGPGSTFPSASRFQLGFSKAPSGDLLDKHSSLFSNRHLPFTPRTLKTEAKSFLSQYRYYTPAKRKKAFTDQRADAETQTEFSSFKPEFETVKTKGFTDSEVDIKQAPNCMTYGTKENVVLSPLQGSGLPGDEMEGGALQRPPTRTVCQCSLQHPSRRKIYSDEEELSYLSFIEDVTDEILNLGLFSNRSLERLFERHVRQNKHRLEEGKMRHLLRILKVNLGCTSEENSGRLDDTDTLDLLDLEKAAHSEHNEQDASIQQERREYRQALDMLLSSPKDENEVFSSHEFFLPVYKSKYSEGVIIQQVGDETNLGPSIWDEKNPSISDGLTDQETSVTVIEGDSDTEKAEPSSELCCLSTALAPSDQLCSVSGDSDDDAGEPALKIMELGIEDGPLDV